MLSIRTNDDGHRWPIAGLAAAAVVTAAICAIHLATPRGVADGTLYTALVLASAWLPWPAAPLGAAVIATLLNVVGYLLSDHGVVPDWFANTNRAIAMAVIWITALLLYRRLELERAIRRCWPSVRFRRATTGTGS
jgi:hypothetical protein